MEGSRSLGPFFFQAEDGIRDVAVTGVQTCALPISSPNQTLSPAGAEAGVGQPAFEQGRLHRPSASRDAAARSAAPENLDRGNRRRSEEHTSELQSRLHLVCRLLLEKKKTLMTEIRPAMRLAE